MANVMMFGFLFLVAVVTEVRAQSSTSTVVTPSTIASNTASSTVFTSPGNSSSPTPDVSPTMSRVTTTPTGTSTMHGGSATSTTKGPTTPTATSAPSTKPPSTKPPSTKPPSNTTKPTTPRKCVAYIREYNHKDVKELDLTKDTFTFLNVQYKVENRSCTTKEKCCKGEGSTTVMFQFENCDNLNVIAIECGDATDLCKCRAGFLSASCLITLVGMLLYFVP